MTPIPHEVVRRRLLARGGYRTTIGEYSERAHRILRTSWNWRARRRKEKRC